MDWVRLINSQEPNILLNFPQAARMKNERKRKSKKKDTEENL